nr:hypothetical protein [Ruminococcus sp.]
MKRKIRNNNGEFIGEYEVLVEEPRQIYIDGKIVNDFSKLDYHTENELNNVIDDFEEGFNVIEDGYEVLHTSKFTVKRKIANIIYY